MTEYKLVALTEEDAAYIGEGIDAIVPHETDMDEEEFVLRVEDEAGEIIGGCVIEAYEYRWRRMYLDTLWVDERYRHHGIGSMILREIERIAKEKGCRVVTLGTASFMARPFYEKHGYTVFTTLKKANGYISYSLVKYLDRDTPEPVNTPGSTETPEPIETPEPNAGDWNVDFFKKNGYLLRGELKDVPKGHNCYELYKNL
jgi:GNAT superfamily N-acetyltransferase